MLDGDLVARLRGFSGPAEMNRGPNGLCQHRHTFARLGHRCIEPNRTITKDRHALSDRQVTIRASIDHQQLPGPRQGAPGGAKEHGGRLIVIRSPSRHRRHGPRPLKWRGRVVPLHTRAGPFNHRERGVLVHLDDSDPSRGHLRLETQLAYLRLRDGHSATQ